MIRLTVDHLHKRFGRRTVLDRISFTQEGGILGIGGRNGSGKSTLLKCLGGLLRPTQGEIEWEIEHQSISPQEIRQHLGFMAPYINLYEELTCLENLEFIIKLRTPLEEPPDPEKRLDEVGLWTHSHQLFGALSTGQQQRLKFAAARIHNPPVLFLDEPGSNLDDEGRDMIYRVISRYREEDNMVLLASNHSAELEWCDRCYYVDEA